MQKVRPVFVYGTLLEGQRNNRLLQRFNKKVENGTIEGFTMYDTGHGYPAIMDGRGTVKGELIHIADEHFEEALHILDTLEGYREHNKQFSLYLRQLVTVTTEAGEKVTAWVYVWNRGKGEMEEIKDGDWVAYWGEI